MGYLILFLICVAFIAYFIYDYDQNSEYFRFLLETKKIGPFLVKHEFIYFMTCFFGTATPAVGAIFFFVKTCIFIGSKITVQ